MARKLATYVHVTAEDGSQHIFGPDDTVPSWATSQITNPKAWAEGSTDDETPPPPDGVVEPPRSGAGSGKDAWAKYAESVGVEVESGASAAEIQAAVDAARTTS